MSLGASIIWKAMMMISNTPTPGYSQGLRCFGQFQHVDGAPQRKNLNNRAVCYVVMLSTLSKIKKIFCFFLSQKRERCCVFYPLSGEGNFGPHNIPSNYSSFYGNPFPTPNLGTVLRTERIHFKSRDPSAQTKTSLPLCFDATKLTLMTKVSSLREDRDTK